MKHSSTLGLSGSLHLDHGARSTSLEDNWGSAEISVAVIDGPYDQWGLSQVLERLPTRVAPYACAGSPGAACAHGTFMIGALGARRDAAIPGLCPKCTLYHIPIFSDSELKGASLAALAAAINMAVDRGARLINLSLAVSRKESKSENALERSLNRAYHSGAAIVVAAGAQSCSATDLLLRHRVSIPVVPTDGHGRLISTPNLVTEFRGQAISIIGVGILGYAPGGLTTTMTGASAATVLATGALARIWSQRLDASAEDIRMAIRNLGPRSGPVPPRLDPHAVLAKLSAQIRHSLFRCSTSFSSEQEINRKVDMNRVRNVQDGMDQSDAGFSRMGGAIALAGIVPSSSRDQAEESGCACCNHAPSIPEFVYVLGTVDVCVPDPSIEEEIHNIARTLNRPAGQISDPGWLHDILSHADARYVARQLYWMVSVEGQPAYVLKLRDPCDWPQLIDCLARAAKGSDREIFVGLRGPVMALPNGPEAHLLFVDQIAETTLVEPIDGSRGSAEPARQKKSERKKTTAQMPSELFNKLVQTADNFGTTESQRALNFLAARYRPLYDLAREMDHKGFQFADLNILESRLSGKRRIVDPVFVFRNRKTNFVERYFVRVDVTHEFPMIATHIQTYLGR
jgi:hypothetical protein